MRSSTSKDTVRVTVRLHSVLRHRDGEIVSQLELKLPTGSRMADVLRLLDVSEEMDVVFALNGQAMESDAELADGDQLQLIPALSGGDSQPGSERYH